MEKKIRISTCEVVVDENKFLETNKATANAYWKAGKKILAQPYIDRVKKYEELTKKD